MPKITHCDIGLSPKMAAALGTKPTIDYLCQDYSGGGSIRGYDVDLDFMLPAALNCPRCKKTIELWREFGTLKEARNQLKKTG